MRISAKDSGGYAGLTAEIGSVDTASMDADAARRIEQAVRQSGFFDLPARVGADVGADLTLREVTVTDGAQQHTVAYSKYDESPATAPLRSLVSTTLGL